MLILYFNFIMFSHYKNSPNDAEKVYEFKNSSKKVRSSLYVCPKVQTYRSLNSENQYLFSFVAEDRTCPTRYPPNSHVEKNGIAADIM